MISQNDFFSLFRKIKLIILLVPKFKINTYEFNGSITAQAFMYRSIASKKYEKYKPFGR